jgi:hypothetical protein
MPVIPVTQEVGIGKIVTQGQPGQQVSKTPSQQNKSGVVVPICNTSYMGNIGKSISFQISSQAVGQKVRLPLKNNLEKRSEGIAQVTELLPNKCNALSSNPSILLLPPQNIIFLYWFGNIGTLHSHKHKIN